MKIAIVTDESRSKHIPAKEMEYEDAQKDRTIKKLKEVISQKYDCISLRFDEDLIENLRKEEVDLVFNLANGIIGASRLSQLPSLLEHEGIPYTGSKPLGHGLAYNKVYTGIVLKELGIPTPDFQYVHTLENLEKIKLEYPLFVKPKDEGSSRGIYQDNIVSDKESLYKKVEDSLSKYNPPIMIMEYLDGREFTVGVIENGKRTLPIVEIDFSQLPQDLEPIYSFEVKNDYQDKVKYHIPARLDEELRDKINNVVLKAFKALDLKDYARVDIRLKDNEPYVIEINSLPGLDKGYSDICKAAECDGIGYEGLIFDIIESAIKRYGLNLEKTTA